MVGFIYLDMMKAMEHKHGLITLQHTCMHCLCNTYLTAFIFLSFGHVGISL